MNVCPFSVRGPRRAQAGVGLIEVLIAVLVLSIGFLGVAALQVHALSTNNSAMARSMATVASYSILDAMRADLPGAKSGSYNTTVQADNCSAPSGSLSSTQLSLWCNQLAAALGASASTTGTILCATATGYCTVTIEFDDSRAAKADNATHVAKVVTRTKLWRAD